MPPLRYLFGPVSAAFADQNLHRLRASGECLAFGPAGVDVTVGASDSWDAIVARLPADWRPDFLALWLPYNVLPECLWSAPLPLVGLAGDWNLLWHSYRRLLPRLELALTDAAGVEALTRAGLPHVRQANLFGCARAFLEEAAGDGPRDIDALFVGNLNAAVQLGRQPWLGRLARLGGRRRVAIRTGVFGADYRALLRRARVVFNRSVRGECNLRAFEAAACGALLFQERGNRETPDYFRDRQECVYYGDDDLEELLEHYLTHEDERRAIAEAARARVEEFRFEALWGRALDLVQEWESLRGRAGRRTPVGPPDALLNRVWQASAVESEADPALVADLEAAIAARPRDAELHNALGAAKALAGRRGRRVAGEVMAQAAACFARALELEPENEVVALNLIEALAALGRMKPAADLARRTLTALGRGGGPRNPDSVRAAPSFGHFRVEWERAAWSHAGNDAAEARAKIDLLRWRLHAILSDLTGDLPHYHEAVLARPDLPTTRAALGCALGRAGRPAEALPHLRLAVAGDPFDLAAARALCQTLRDAGDPEGARRGAEDCRLLAKAAPHLPAEPWFADDRPAGDGLASIIILCCNELEYTRLCLESVLARTRPPYELVLVDNGSTDGTPEFLQEVRSRPGPARVEVVRSDTNLGFPTGCNRGLAEARGRWVVFLNNDTVVTEGWLEGLVAWALHDWPKTGLVGAVTNCSRPPQQVAVDYAGLDGLEAFAGRRRREYAGKAQAVERLTGFCLLAHRDVLDRVGGFDERFGVGFFDDDDLSVKVLRAGFRLLVSLNVFVHHFGSRTFTSLGLDCARQLGENLQRFKDKWGEAEAAGYRTPDGPAPAATVPAAPAAAPPANTIARPRMSLCMIVRNEEHNLPACLNSVAGLFDEIVVVDTGSTDRTKEIAAAFGARVFDFPWCDNFAAARNEALRHATGDWIFWMDADDRLDDANREKLRILLAGLGDENAAYSMKCLCLPDPVTREATQVDHVRLFRNHPGLRWRYRVHEQILPAVRSTGAEVRWSDVVVHHVGYQDPALRRRKLERDLRLLRLEDAGRPDDPFTLFNLGATHLELGKPAEALPMLRRSLERSHPADSIVRKLYALVAQCHRRLGQSEQALAALGAGRRHYPDDAELLFLEGLTRRERGDLPGAAAALERLLDVKPGKHFASVAVGLGGHKARQNLAVVYRQMGRAAEAEAQWRRVASERPDFAPAWLGLGELHLAQGRYGDVEEDSRALEGAAGAPAEATALRGRVLLARGDAAGARALVERAVASVAAGLPGGPRVVLAQMLLQDGRDPDAAERALREVLAIDPHHAESRHNLSVLLRQKALLPPGDAVFAENVPLAQLYQAACRTPTDINEHLPTLYQLATECRHVTELGTRTGVSTTALLYAQPDRLVCYDRVRYPQVEALRQAAGRTEFIFREKDVLWVEIEETDLLFIDTLHDYEQLREELRRHAPKAKKYIVLHDTTTFGQEGETEGHQGLWPAVEEFLAQGTFRLHSRYENNNGLTVLAAVGK